MGVIVQLLHHHHKHVCSHQHIVSMKGSWNQIDMVRLKVEETTNVENMLIVKCLKGSHIADFENYSNSMEVSVQT